MRFLGCRRSDMRKSTKSAALRVSLSFAALAVCLPVAASAAAMLDASVGGLVFISSSLQDGPHQEEGAAAGPVEAEVEAGLVLDYFPNVSGGAFTVEGTVFAGGQAWADYGINRAAISVGLRNTTGDDRGAFLAGPLGGGIPFNSSIAPNASANSGWQDGFVINGGTGLGEALVSVALHGDAGREAGGVSGLAEQTAFAGFNDHGGGTVQYRLPAYPVCST